jgi:phosphoribosylformylglycinamidine (FGAM) synthase-like enzyme
MSLLRVACAETPGRFLIEVKEEDTTEVEEILRGSTWSWIGTVTNDSLLTVRCGENSIVAQTSINKLATAWREPSTAQTPGVS